MIMPLFILGVKIDNLSKELVWQKISEILKSPENKGLQLVTVNPEFVLAAQKDANFLRIINHAWLAVPDGYGLRLAAKYLDLVSRVSFPPRVVARGKLWREFNFGRLLLITYYLLLGLKIAWWGMLRNDKKLDIIKETITGTDLIPEICKILSVIPDNSNVIPAQAGIQEYPLLKKEGRGEVNSPIGASGFRLTGRNDKHGNHEKYFLYFGRVSAEKGINILIETAKEIPDAKFKIAGEGPEFKNYVLRIMNYGLKNIELLGYKNFDELQNLIQSAYLIIVPSLTPETFGFSALEAMALGKCVVASEVGALPELVDHNFLFTAGNVF